jgi:hypothetical protein
VGDCHLALDGLAARLVIDDAGEADQGFGYQDSILTRSLGTNWQ